MMPEKVEGMGRSVTCRKRGKCVFATLGIEVRQTSPDRVALRRAAKCSITGCVRLSDGFFYPNLYNQFQFYAGHTIDFN